MSHLKVWIGHNYAMKATMLITARVCGIIMLFPSFFTLNLSLPKFAGFKAVVLTLPSTHFIKVDNYLSLPHIDVKTAC